jgi:hypothetical protein
MWGGRIKMNKLAMAIELISRAYKKERQKSTREILVECIGEDAVRAKEKEWCGEV